MKFFAVLVFSLCALNVLAAPSKEKRLGGSPVAAQAPAAPALFGGAQVGVSVGSGSTGSSGSSSGASSGATGGSTGGSGASSGTTGGTSVGAVPNLLQNLLNGVGNLVNSLLKALGLGGAGTLTNTLANTGLTSTQG